MFRTAPTAPTRTAPPARRVLAALTACAMALTVITTSAAPALAERNDDLARALAAIAIIGIIAHEANKDRDHAPAPKPDPVYHPHPKPPVYHPPVYHAPRVPAACAIQIEGKRGDRTFYAARCLRQKGFDYRLPKHCARDIRYYGHNDRIYSEQCLRDAGFRIGGHGRNWDNERPQN